MELLFSKWWAKPWKIAWDRGTVCRSFCLQIALSLALSHSLTPAALEDRKANSSYPSLVYILFPLLPDDDRSGCWETGQLSLVRSRLSLNTFTAVIKVKWKESHSAVCNMMHYQFVPTVPFSRRTFWLLSHCDCLISWIFSPLLLTDWRQDDQSCGYYSVGYCTAASFGPLYFVCPFWRIVCIHLLPTCLSLFLFLLPLKRH